MYSTENVKIRLQYPRSDEFEFKARLERINLDEEREKDIRNGTGFVIREPQSIKKDLKNDNSIFSSRFGQSLDDVNTFMDRYKCKCGLTTSKINEGTVCPHCKTVVEYVGEDLDVFGWICFKDPYYIIHPNIFKEIEFFIGVTKFDHIIHPVIEKDENGFDKKIETPKDEPFYGYGMIKFKDHFDEIMNYYLLKGNKKDYYDDIMSVKDKIFIQSVPVYTTLLRPFKVEGEKLYFEGTNENYNVLAKISASINIDGIRIFRQNKPKTELLYNAQIQYNIIYAELVKTLSNKKGVIRTLFGGRCNFTNRSVIRADPSLRSDEIKLPYSALVELLQQSIVNILHMSYKYSYANAYKEVYKAGAEYNEHIASIINFLIKDYPRGLPVLINRNPTIQYGSILQMYCIGINLSFTMSMPLSVLSPLGADFDGDTLNILYIINKAFLARAEEVFNVRNAMNISRNDGLFDNQVNRVIRDTAINANTMIHLSRDKYSESQLEKIRMLKNISSIFA